MPFLLFLLLLLFFFYNKRTFVCVFVRACVYVCVHLCMSIVFGSLMQMQLEVSVVPAFVLINL